MRPGQNKRMRGRNNRKGPNPLTRAYESNGPDVKVRGTAQHIAEKYLQLARDAQSSGDPVMAESYLQHSEHPSHPSHGRLGLVENFRELGDRFQESVGEEQETHHCSGGKSARWPA